MALHVSDDLLVPVPGPEESLREPQVLGTWHAALSNVVGTDIPHDLLAVWFYPASGGASLVGPAALGQDELHVPLPAPRIGRPQLDLLEEIVRDAGYGSVACFAARHEREDVGLLLVASFQSDFYDDATRGRLSHVARRIAPTLARLADPDSPDTLPSAEARVLDGLGNTTRKAQSPRGFARGASEALDRLIPHDRIDLLIPGASPEQTYRLSAHEDGSLWSDMTLIVPQDLFDPASVLGGSSPVVVEDALMAPGWSGWSESTRHATLRSALGVPLVVGERTVGYLLVGATLVGIYDTHDAELLARLAPGIASRVEGLVQVHQLRVLRTQLGSAHAVPNQLRRMATVMATCPDASSALREYVSEATALLPFHRVRFALKTLDVSRVIMLVPGETRAVQELPSVPVSHANVARVISGETLHAVMGGGVEVELVFPLRINGRVTGAMILTTSTPDAFTRVHLALAQQLADGVAAWIELQRRPVSVPIL
jgi:GAF domain-containing protein